DGLRGKEIPLAARIVSLADSFDAMTSTRPYRVGLPLDFAIKEMQRMSGRQFCPDVVEAFVRILRASGAADARGVEELAEGKAGTGTSGAGAPGTARPPGPDAAAGPRSEDAQAAVAKTGDGAHRAA